MTSTRAGTRVDTRAGEPVGAARATAGVASVPGRAAFIVGVSRSGTSLLLSLLDGHPRVLALPLETKVFQWCGADDPVASFFERTQYGKRLLEQGSDVRAAFEAAMRARLAGPARFDAALTAVAAACAAVWPRPQAEVWIEKTPRHRNQLPLLLRGFGPPTRGLVVVRDPRGTFASHKGRWDRKGERAARRFARKWLTVHALTGHFLRREMGVTVTRYEDFVLDTSRELARVAGHLGLDDHPALRAPTKLGADWSGNSSFDDGCTRDPQLARARDAAAPAQIDRDGVERWRRVLDEAEVATLERLLGPAMRSYGYVPETGADARRFDPARLRLRLACRLLLAERRQRWRRDDPGESADDE